MRFLNALCTPTTDLRDTRIIAEIVGYVTENIIRRYQRVKSAAARDSVSKLDDASSTDWLRSNKEVIAFSVVLTNRIGCDLATRAD